MNGKEKGLSAVLAAAAVLLFCGCIWVYLQADRTPPVIETGGTALVYDGSDERALLEGVTATDDVDGPVRVAVEKVEEQEDGSVTVTYVAMDSAGNQARAVETIGQAAPETETPETAPAETVPAETAPTETAAPETETQPVNPEAPVITLTATEAVIGAGEPFNYFNYIADVTDDVDDYDTLTRRIRVTGDQDSYGPGQYQITYDVLDTDGNPSNTAVLNLTVQ